jgi:N utilization substance protein B
MGSPGPRRKAREAALQVLFAVDVSQKIEPASVEEAYGAIVREFSLPARARERAGEIALGVASNLDPIDERIERACTHWKLHRLAAVDRNILRIAAYELLFEPSTPAEVIMDEAVEIARRFSGESSPAFVNGVLDVIAHERLQDQP